MLRIDAMRTRLLAVIGVGGLVLAATECGGETGRDGAQQGAGGAQAGAAGALATGGTLPCGANCGCPPAEQQCFSPVELDACLSAGGNAGAAQGGGSGTASAGASGVECPDLAAVSACITVDPLYGGYPASGPTKEAEACCYTVQPGCLIGRPFLVSGTPRTAPPSPRCDWCATIDGLDAVADPALARALASGWRDDALLEHASIASFARFTLELLALGAPAELLAAAQQAGLDEIRHSKLCFALAAHYAGTTVGPGELDISHALGQPDLATLAVRTALEGCIGETVAAVLAAEQASLAPIAMRELLAEVAEDETRHAELAWRTVHWAIETGGERVRAAVSGAFCAALACAAPAEVTGADSDALRAHGRLTARDASELRSRVLGEVVAPCASALLTATATTWARARSAAERSRS